MTAPAVVIGAGPYGLSIAAHLRARGVPVRVFGEVMSSWRLNMPRGMCLKSTPAASGLSTPLPGYELADFCKARGIPPLTGTQVVPIELFVSYGEWFQQQLVPDVENVQIRRLERAGRGFRLELSDGTELLTDVVVMATLNPREHRLPPSL